MRFTDRSISVIKPKAQRYELWEDGRTGFGVRVSTRGRKSWLYMYRFDGKARRMTLGTYPEMSLADANFRVAEAKRTLSEGRDPGLEHVEARRAKDAGIVFYDQQFAPFQEVAQCKRLS